MEESASTLAANDGKITYGALKPNWFAISGVNENHIFYLKTFLSHDQFKSFEITYPESAAAGPESIDQPHFIVFFGPCPLIRLNRIDTGCTFFITFLSTTPYLGSVAYTPVRVSANASGSFAVVRARA